MRRICLAIALSLLALSPRPSPVSAATQPVASRGVVTDMADNLYSQLQAWYSVYLGARAGVVAPSGEVGLALEQRGYTAQTCGHLSHLRGRAYMPTRRMLRATCGYMASMWRAVIASNSVGPSIPYYKAAVNALNAAYDLMRVG